MKRKHLNKMRVVGVGQCSFDYLAVVDEYPAADTKKEIIGWHEQGGGPVATALVALSRLGVPCDFHGVTGDDPEGQKIKQSLISEGIDVRGLLKRKDSCSQIAFIVIEKHTAKRTIFWKRPSGEPLRSGEIGDDFLLSAEFLLIDGLMKDISLFAAQRAREKGVPVMLDAGKVRPGMIETAGLADYVVASEEFAREIGWDLGEASLQRAREKLGTKVLTVTSGERGSATNADGIFFRTDAFRVKGVDTTGAGDVFHGGYIYGLLRGWDIKTTVIFASALAAMKCRTIGGRAGIPGLEEVREFLAERGFNIS